MLEKKSSRIRKEEIILAALDVVGNKGVRGLTIAAIAESAGMSQANIYRHFSGKDEVLNAVAKFISRSVMGKAAVVAGESRKPLEKLETIFRSHVSLIAEYPGIPRFVFSDELHLGYQTVAATLAMRIGTYLETITGVIAAAAMEREVKPGLGARETAVTFLGMIQFTALRWTIGNGNFDINKEADSLWKNFLDMTR